MKLTTEEVKKISGLARIGLSSFEITKFQSELSEVVDYNAKKLSEVSKKNTPVIDLSKDLGQADETKPSLTQDEALVGTPESVRGYFVVPKVLDQ